MRWSRLPRTPHGRANLALSQHSLRMFGDNHSVTRTAHADASHPIMPTTAAGSARCRAACQFSGLLHRSGWTQAVEQRSRAGRLTGVAERRDLDAPCLDQHRADIRIYIGAELARVVTVDRLRPVAHGGFARRACTIGPSPRRGARPRESPSSSRTVMHASPPSAWPVAATFKALTAGRGSAGGGWRVARQVPAGAGVAGNCRADARLRSSSRLSPSSLANAAARSYSSRASCRPISG